MANWCFNSVSFNVEEEQMEQLETLFITMLEREILEDKGQLPAFFSSDNGYLFYIEYEACLLAYSTKWAPNIEVIKAIADHYHADFKHSYSETAMCIYGEAVYENGELIVIDLDWEDFSLYEFDQEKDCYIFEGNTYEDDDEILHILLERKKMGL